MSNFGRFKKMPQVGYKSYKTDLNSASIYSSYYLVTPQDAIQQNTNSYGPIWFIWDPQNNSKQYILRKLHPYQLSILQGTLVCLYELQSWQN